MHFVIQFVISCVRCSFVVSMRYDIGPTPGPYAYFPQYQPLVCKKNMQEKLDLSILYGIYLGLSWKFKTSTKAANYGGEVQVISGGHHILASGCYWILPLKPAGWSPPPGAIVPKISDGHHTHCYLHPGGLPRAPLNWAQTTTRRGKFFWRVCNNMNRGWRG